jgi:uncharacterized membrane protein
MRKTLAITSLIVLALAVLICIQPASAGDGYETVFHDWDRNGTFVYVEDCYVTPLLNGGEQGVQITVSRAGYQDMVCTVSRGNSMDFYNLIRIFVVDINSSTDRVYLEISRPAQSTVAPVQSGTALTCTVLGQKALGGDSVTFPIAIQNNDRDGRTYSLSASSDAGWGLTFLSGGKNVYKVYVPGQQSLTVDLAVQTSAASGIGEKRVTAHVDNVPIDLYVYVTSVNHTAGVSAKYGSVVASIGDKVLYELRIKNSKPAESDYRLAVTDLPAGWYYRFKEDAASTAEISETIVAAGAEKAVALEITPPYSVAPGDYAFTATVTSPDNDVITKSLTLKLKSGADMVVSTPKLSYDAKPGQTFEISLYVNNAGRGVALTNVLADVTAPSGWITTVSPNQTASIAAGSSGTIRVKVQPPGNIVASDYPVSIKVKSDQGAKTFDYTIRVSTDSYIPYIGAGIIIVVVAGLFLVVRKFGRR